MRFSENTSRAVLALTLAAGAVVFSGCHHNNAVNPIANVDSKQPDKVLFDRALVAVKSGKYEIARSLLQTMINTYPDSEFVARAKLSIADSWYAEGNTAAYAQAEREYRDFITFFPNMPEAAEAQMKIANIHYDEMGKPDRDYTQAKRAEDEYRQMIQSYPDHKLVPLAKQRLRDVQEVLGEGQFDVARFYYGRESWPAAIARLKTLADTYPLYSQADESLYLLGQAYENEMHIMQNPKMKLKAKTRQQLVTDFRKNAIDAYSRIMVRYPAGQYADLAGKHLQGLEAAVPRATPEMIAQNKQEIASRSEAGITQRVLLNFSHRPDTSLAVKVGEPTMDDPQQASAPAIAQHANDILLGKTGENKVGAEVVNDKDAVPGVGATESAAPKAETPAQPAPAPSFEAVPENPNGTGSTSSSTTVNDLGTTPKTTSTNTRATTAPASSDTTATAAPSGDAAQPTPATAPASSAEGTAQPATATAPDSNSKTESSSTQTKKKKHRFNPF